ncbi:MAG: hypothetical protein R2684_09050 [Pyrinomonadaceae bacterium]
MKFGRLSGLVLAIVFAFALSSNLFAQTSRFTGKWEYWWDKEASKGFVIELIEKDGIVTGTASGFIPHMYEAEIKSIKVSGKSFTADIEDDWGNTGVVKITVKGNKLTWKVLRSKREGSMTFPDRSSLQKVN